MAASFDPRSQKLTGIPFQAAENVQTLGLLKFGMFSAADDGTLAYLQGNSTVGRELVWYDLTGQRLGTLGGDADYQSIFISPDGKSVSVHIPDYASGNNDIWVYNIDRQLPLRITSHPAEDQFPVWSPDSKRIVFNSSRSGSVDLYLKEVDSLEPEKPLVESPESKYPLAWSPDGKSLLFVTLGATTRHDLWLRPMTGEFAKPEPFLQTEHSENLARFSPDGRWVVYVSDDQRVQQVFVISFPDKRGKVLISKSGGTSPSWSPDGKKIYYLDLENYIVEVALQADGTGLIPSEPKPLFQIQPGSQYATYAIAPDGQRFLVNSALHLTNSSPVKMVLNWSSEFRKR